MFAICCWEQKATDEAKSGDTRAVPDQSIAARRLHANRLVGTPLERPEDVVRWLCAVQSQDYHGAKWALAQRCGPVTDTELDALFDAGAILRTHVLRPTWHFVAPEDLGWLLRLTGPRVHVANAHMYRQLGIDEQAVGRSRAVIERALASGRHLTRAEIGQSLREAGLDAEGLRLTYLVMRAELDGVICSGPRRGRQFTYALFEERAPDGRSLDRDEALAELAVRYFASHGPAELRDLAWGSGLTIADVRIAVAAAGDALRCETIDGTDWWSASEATPVGALESPVVHLLPNYDEYLIGHRDHRPTSHPSLRERTRWDEELGPHVITVDGLVVGGWRRTISGDSVSVAPNLLVALSDDERTALDVAVERYARFLGRPVTIK